MKFQFNNCKALLSGLWHPTSSSLLLPRQTPTPHTHLCWVKTLVPDSVEVDYSIHLYSWDIVNRCKDVHPTSRLLRPLTSSFPIGFSSSLHLRLCQHPNCSHLQSQWFKCQLWSQTLTPQFRIPHVPCHHQDDYPLCCLLILRPLGNHVTTLLV